MSRIAAFLALAFLLVAAVAARAEEYIDSYHADIAVAKNGALTVTETIRVHAEGNQIRRGIFRDFPLTFVDRDGRERQVGFDIESVERDGEAEPYHTESARRGVRIYIGSSDTELSPGFHDYRLTYRTTRQIRFFDTHDELFWNVTGTEWAFSIRSASAAITLPEGVRAGELVAFTGAYGGTGKDARTENRGDVAMVRTTRTLAPHEGLTVGVRMPVGSIDPPSAADERAWWFRDNRGLIIAGTGLALVLAYYGWAWAAVGRDPSAGVIVPRWDAPEGLSPALVNYIDEKGFRGAGWTAISATFLSLAVKGLVQLDDLKSSIVVTRTAKSVAGRLPTSEAEVLKALPSAGAQLLIDRAHGERVQTLGTSFRNAMEREHRQKYYHANRPYVAGGVVLSLLCLGVLLLFGGLDEEAIAAIAALAFPAVFLSVFAVNIGRSLLRARSLGARIVAVIVTAFVGFVFLSIFGGLLLVMLEEDLAADWMLLLGAIGGIMVANLVFFFLMGAPTPLGRRMMDGIAGLRQYLVLAEKDRMNMAGAPEMSPRHYETLLPYAVALGVEKPWSETFERWLATATAAGAAAAWQPGWYNGDGLSSGRLSGRMGEFAGSMADTLTASLPPPPKSSSSGFSSSGGGGFSGGGGGGGGGGGW